jgi:actin-related protein 5
MAKSLKHSFIKSTQERLGLGDTSLIIAFGFHTVHLVPVVGGAIDATGIRRINVGGFHLVNYLHRALQLKYPAHTNSITVRS